MLEMNSVLKAFVVLLGIPAMIALLFVPAGTLYWPGAWLVLAELLVYALVTWLWLKKNNPELLRKRTSLEAPIKGWDKIIVLLASVFLIALFPVAGLDAVRFQLTQMPFALNAAGFVGIGLALCALFLVIRENPFLSRIVEVQKKEEQKVVSTGPYAIVRHPMYAAFIAMSFCIPLALGSLYAFIPALLSAIAIIARTTLEDNLLQKELQGYKGYTKKVRYRLLPGIW